MILQKEYKIKDKTFVYDHKSAVDSYRKYCEITDEEFIENILNILHFAVYICYIKNLKTEDVLSDTGIIHELVHLTKENTRKFVDIKNIRKLFAKTLHLNN